MRELSLSHDATLRIENIHLVLFRTQSTPTNHAKVSSAIASLLLHTGRHDACRFLYWRTGRDFLLGIRRNQLAGTHVQPWCFKRRGILVAPGGSARLASLRQALTEPDAGSDLNALRTRAKRMDGGWVISGAKQFISHADTADHIVVLALADPAAKLTGRLPC